MQFGSDAKTFVGEDFYVDDGLKSLPDLLRRTQSMLGTANLHLQKIASNNADVTEAFPSSERASETPNHDLNVANNDV